MDVMIRKSCLNGRLPAPPSKSHTHRAFFLASMTHGEKRIKNPLISKDTTATLDAFKKLGASTYYDKEGFLTISGLGFDKKTDTEKRYRINDSENIEPVELDLKNSGTSLRFMTAASGLFDKRITLYGDDSLNSRPNGPLIKALENLGAKIESTYRDGCLGFAPLVSSENNINTFSGGKTEISGDQSSQFLSALLMTAPFLENDSQIHVTGKQVSAPYIRLTEHVVSTFLGDVVTKKTVKAKNGISESEEKKETVYHVKGRKTQKKMFEKNGKCCEKQTAFDKQNEYAVPGDFSSAAYIMGAAVLLPDSNVTLENLYPSYQADERIVPILENMGFNVSWNRKTGFVNASFKAKQTEKKEYETEAYEIDALDIPDLVPTLAVIASFSNRNTRIFNTDHLRFKETDRIRTTADLLRRFDVNVCEKNERKGEIVINCAENNKGFSKTKKEKIDPSNDILEIDVKKDHRLAMACAVAGLCRGNVFLKNAESVYTSYPDFWKDLKRLGAVIE